MATIALSQTQHTGLRQTQTQMLAPHLRQSLELLQAPLMELRALIRGELEQNPTLEELPERDEPIEAADPADETGVAETGVAEDADSGAAELEFQERYDRLTRLDDDWRDFFEQTNPGRAPDPEAAQRHDRLLESLTRTEGLQEHLLTQVGLAGLSEDDRALAIILIGSLNDDGYLNATLGEITETTGQSLDRLERVLAALQQFDPPGVGARDLRECLDLQLRRDGRGRATAAAIVRDHLDALAARRHAEIARALGVSVVEVHRAAAEIAALEPRPGRGFGSETIAYVTPEVTITLEKDEYVARYNRDRTPRLRISRAYRQLLENPGTAPETRRYLKDKIRAGDLLIRSIEQRRQTLLAIAGEIARRQRGFFERGVDGLVPLTMSEIAAAVKLHETTISRAVNGKFAETPRGIYELRYFFTAGYRADDGRAVSNTSVKDAVARIVGAENPAAPLSDQEIAARLTAEGVRVARRTVAKYREELRIPPSHERRT